MLTGKMVRVRHAKNKLVPLYVEPGDESLVALAEQLLLAYRGSPGRTRGEIEDEFSDLIPEGPRGLLPAGLAKLLEDRCEFEVAADHLSRPGAQWREQQEAGFVRHDPPLEAWLDGFLHHWLEQDVVRPKAAKACAVERDVSVATGL